ncbi:MAG: hypothetical protein CMH56_08095 [Myxococcales bacterium]|nr:hypothetical protein [Myxococcales bacterium]|tara:strand:- start:55 stop:963 length:909 start_codon:yes stop_codon:yes gene_type:complete
MSFSLTELKPHQEWIEALLQSIPAELSDPFDTYGTPDLLRDSMAHALLAGGKRLRPLLVLHAAKSCKPDWSEGDHKQHCRYAAAAIEMIHTYSLIHDDLPALDNDDLRRGKPTCHIAFGEAQAILAGDGLLTDAFNLLAQAPVNPHLQVLELSRAAGSNGMVAGQVDDIQAERLPSAQIDLKKIHRRKTARLLASACRLGGLSVNASDAQLEHLTQYGFALGIAFQIADDVLDHEADPELAGKKLGRDAQNDKTTYLTLLGAEEAKKQARDFANQAAEHANALPGNHNTLVGLAHFSANRLF